MKTCWRMTLAALGFVVSAVIRLHSPHSKSPLNGLQNDSSALLERTRTESLTSRWLALRASESTALNWRILFFHLGADESWQLGKCSQNRGSCPTLKSARNFTKSLKRITSWRVSRWKTGRWIKRSASLISAFDSCDANCLFWIACAIKFI